MFINDTCMACGMCSEYCPNEAIVEKESNSKGYSQYMIIEEKCVDCGACLEAGCPADAIKEE